MKRRFTILTAALALLTFLAVPMGMWGQTRTQVTWDSSQQNYSNGQEVTSVRFDACISATFEGGKYYTTGTAVRVYGGKTFTISANNNSTISQIDITFGSGDGSNAITANTGSYENGTWTGTATSVIFTVGGSSGHRRLKAFAVTYSGGTGPTTYTVTLGDDNSTLTQSSVGASVTLPTRDGIGDYLFEGWSETNVENETTTAPTIIPAGNYTPTADITLYPVYSRTESGSGPTNANASVTISEYASTNNWISGNNSGPQYTEVVLNEDITAITTGTGNNGKYYNDWRFYQNGNGNVIITTSNGELSSVTFTFTVSNGGTLNYNSSAITSGTAVEVSGTSVEFIVGNSGSATNGQVRITAISVNYTTTGSTTTYYWSWPVVSTDPYITIDSEEFELPANGDESYLEITYGNFTPNSFEYMFCDANGNELSEDPNWIDLAIEAPDGENGDFVHYIVGLNDGEERTAYFKVYASLGEGLSDVYSNIVTVTQLAPEVDYASLPFEWDTFGTTPTGITNSGVSTGSSNAYLKFDTSGDYIVLKTNETPGALTFDVKGNPGQNGWEGTFKVQTSTDGTTYSDIVTYNDLPTDEYQSESFTALNGEVRYIKWVYTTKTAGNVALDNILVTKAMPITESTTWTDGTNVPVDNYTYIVNNGATLTLEGNYSTYFDKPYYLVVKDGGQLIAENPGQGTVQKNIHAATNWGAQPENEAEHYTPDYWYLLASPIYDNLNPENGVNGLATANYDLYKLDNTQTKPWYNYKAHTFTIDPEKGYLYASATNTTIEFAGELTPYDDMYEVTVANPGFNLVGNPLPCNVIPVNVEGDPIDYQVLNSTGSEFMDGSDPVAPCNAILVETTTANEKVYFVDPSWEAKKGRSFSLNLGENGRQISNARVRFGEGRGMSKFYLSDNSTRIYIPQNDKEMAVVFAEAQGEMPVNFRAAENGTYTLTMDVENVEMNYLHLIDNMTGKDINLLQTPSYTFEANVNDYESRFRLVFAGASTSSATDESFAFFSNGNWIINNAGEATLQVIDLTGRILSSESVNGSVSTTLNATPGVYMLRLINGENVKVQKIVVR